MSVEAMMETVERAVSKLAEGRRGEDTPAPRTIRVSNTPVGVTVKYGAGRLTLFYPADLPEDKRWGHENDIHGELIAKLRAMVDAAVSAKTPAETVRLQRAYFKFCEEEQARRAGGGA